jgi:hypothetical protein
VFNPDVVIEHELTLSLRLPTQHSISINTALQDYAQEHQIDLSVPETYYTALQQVIPGVIKNLNLDATAVAYYDALMEQVQVSLENIQQNQPPALQNNDVLRELNSMADVVTDEMNADFDDWDYRN